MFIEIRNWLGTSQVTPNWKLQGQILVKLGMIKNLIDHAGTLDGVEEFRVRLDDFLPVSSADEGKDVLGHEFDDEALEAPGFGHLVGHVQDLDGVLAGHHF